VQRRNVLDRPGGKHPDRFAVCRFDTLQPDRHRAVVELDQRDPQRPPGAAGQNVLWTGGDVETIGTVGKAFPVDPDLAFEDLLELACQSPSGAGLVRHRDRAQVEQMRGPGVLPGLGKIQKAFKRGLRSVPACPRLSSEAGVQSLDFEVDIAWSGLLGGRTAGEPGQPAKSKGSHQCHQPRHHLPLCVALRV
jgi:hypothetical protein